MSLGSVARSESMPQEFKQVFIETFSKLPYKVLWKYEDESITGLPDNVMIKKWMPQQDIVGKNICNICLSSVKNKIFN